MKIPEYETNNIEFKQQISRRDKFSWLKKVSAMANSISGGKVIIGVADDREILGVENVGETIDLFTQETSNCIVPNVQFDIQIKRFEEHEVIFISVFSGKQPPYILKESGGRHIPYVMRGNTSVPASPNDIVQLALRASNLSWDSLQHSTNDQLTFEILARKHEDVLKKSITSKDLYELGLVSEDNPTNAGVLFSDENPNMNSWISVTKWPGLDKTSDEKVIDREIKGSIIHQIDEAYSFIVDNIRKEFSFNKTSPQREEEEEYDLLAIREVLINAVVHRDYSINNNQQIEVSIYDDRIAVKSTGSLLNEHSVEDLINLQTIGRRNPIICNVMKELRYIESRGRGIEKIINPSLAWTKEPEFVNGTNFFMATLYSRFYVYNQVEELDEIEMRIVEYIKKHNSVTSDIVEQITGYKKTRANEILNDLRKKEIIERGKSRPYKYTLKKK